MNFKEAREELLNIAKGRYCSISYEEDIHEDEETEVTCRLYISGFESKYAGNWDVAMYAIKKEVGVCVDDKKFTGRPEVDI